MKKLTTIIAVVMMVLSLCGCSAKTAEYSGTSAGFGGDVTVTITVDENGKLVDVKVEGKDETATIGGAALDTLKEQIKAVDGYNIDGVSGASVTSNAVKDAARKAFAAARGEELAEAVMADGTYTASAWGFSKNYPLNVEVVIKDNKMESITVTDNGETDIIMNTAVEYMIPQMIEYQSVKVDSTTGASTSSAAIKLATEDCLLQALKAGGSDETAIANFYTVPEKSTENKTIDTDVLVVGMGGAGIVTGTRAVEADSSVKVLMIDKAAKFGGTSVTTTSPMSINPSYFVEQNNGENFVDADVLKADWMNYTEGDAKEWAIDYMMEQSGPAIDWLIGKGFVFGAPTQGLSAPYKVCTNYGNQFAVPKHTVQTYFDAIINKYTELGGEYMLQVEATDLIMDNGKVCGVKAVGADGTSYTINAKSVVLATGGFAGNGEMQDKYLSNEYYNLAGGGQYNVFGMTQNDGKMIQSAIDNGASTYNIGMPPVSHIGGAYMVMHEFPILDAGYTDIWTGLPATYTLNDVPMMMAVAPNSLAVNRQGVRFMDETTLAAYGNWAAGAYFYTIWSDEQIKNIEENGLAFDTIGIFVNQGGYPSHTPIPEIYDILAKGEEMGYIFSGDSLSDLASKIGVDAATLENTVSEYNTYCETGICTDGVEKNTVIYDLSGNPLEGDYQTFEKVEGTKYYAVKGSPWIYSTTAALNVNENFQVLDTNEAPIEGLYAVGTDCLGMLFTEKKEYVTYGGADQGWAFTSGYLAGPIVAASAK